jgi:DNA-binding NarL/FixJ family response regulator
MDRPIRVAVANTPRLLRELMIETMADQVDIKIVAEIQEESEIPRLVAQTVPEFLIMTVDPPDPCPPVCVSLLQLYPKLKILALAAEKNSGVLYAASVHITATPLEVSESGLLEALRSKSQGEMGETQ